MFSYKNAHHQVIGPLPADAIRQLIAGGAIGRNSLLRAEGSGFWQPAGKFAEFREFLDRIHGATTPDAEEAVQAAAPVIKAGAGVVTENHSPRPDPGSTADAPPPLGTAAGPGESDADQYFMIGGDGREYGPVPADRLREWIGQRRADRDTRVRRAGDANHVPLGTLAAFAAAFATSGAPPPPPPPVDAGAADRQAAEILGRGYDLSIAHCLRRSWRLYQSNFGVLTAATGIVILAHMLLHALAGIGTVASIALSGALTVGMSAVFLGAIRGGTPVLNNLAAGFKRGFVPLLLASVVTFILVVVGIVFCALPGIYLFVAWVFVPLLVYERALDFWSAMELSRRVVHDRWWEIFALVLVSTGLWIGGALLTFFIFGVGAFFTAPIALGALLYGYEDIFGERRTTAGEVDGSQAKETLV